jgi:hypothetical protein
MMFACSPFWRTGTMVICKCSGHIFIELNDRHQSAVCCNFCKMDRSSDERNQSICSCTGIPLSSEFDHHAVSCNSAEDDEKPILYVDYRIPVFMDSNQQHLFSPAAFDSGTGNKALDILRTTILLI